MSQSNVLVTVFPTASNMGVHRPDGNILSLSSLDHTLIEFKDREVIKDHGFTVSAERYLDILAEFLHHRVVRTLWDRVEDGRAELLGYQLWERSGPDGKMYQVTNVGAAEPAGISGYYNLESMLKLKGIIR